MNALDQKRSNQVLASNDLVTLREYGRRRSRKTLGTAILLAAIGLASPPTTASAQWKSNPEFCNANTDETPFLMIPVGGGVVAIDQALNIFTLDSHGYLVDQQALKADFSPMPGSSVSNVVGCSLGSDRFAIACTVTSSASPNPAIRLIQYHASPKQDHFTFDFDTSNFPLEVGIATKLAIAPNVTDAANGTVDGVVLAWRFHGAKLLNSSLGLYAQLDEVRQQAIHGDATLTWGGSNATDGLLVCSTGAIFDAAMNCAPSVVSDGNGRAIVTYCVRSDGSSITDDPADSRVHWTTKRDSDSMATILFDCEVPGQSGSSPGDCLVTGDGSGGAFYAYSNDVALGQQVSGTNLMRARVSFNGGVKEGYPFWTSAVSPKTRPLAIAPTRHQSFAILYRDLTAMHTIAFGASTGLPGLWTHWVQGASGDNSDQAAGTLGPSYLAFAWTSTERVGASGLDEVDGHAMWPTSQEAIIVNLDGDAPSEPRIVATTINCGTYPAGFIVGWRDHDQYQAERVNDIGEMASPCVGDMIDYGDGTGGVGGIAPKLHGTGYPALGTTINLTISNGASFAPCVLLIGFAPASLPILGGTLNVAPPFLSTMLPLGPMGDISLLIALPNDPSLTGFSAYMQGLVLDQAAIHGVSMTQGLKLTIGE